MDLTYTAEQELLRKTVRQFVTDRVTPERLAEIADGPDGWDPGLWKETVELGLTSVSLPEELGGAGLGFVEEAIVAEEFGRGLFPGPWLGSVLARPALTGHVLQAVAAERHVTTLVGLTAPLVAEGSAVTGRADHVVDLAAADLLVVLTGEGVFFVDRDETDWRLLPTVDGTRRLGQVALESTPAARVSGPDPRLAQQIRTRAHAALAAEAVGVASGAVEFAVEYAKERQQFGRPIGSFQAVSHQVADAFMDAELARSLAMWAAAAVDAGDTTAPLAAATAKWFAAEAAMRATERAIQVHGGIGFTWEHPLHRFYKRALWIASQFGTGAELRARAAASLLR
ncbi:MAG TPA: acyl-CoA dehydrogenase family protein [Actinomycetota bacterium]|nr:acyl-CoA dehydrogenase family protein [Actinomycetota bacterium]